MSAARRHKKHHHEEHENHERWLVSGYDMMTLLFAVFVVLFAISSTNISKVKLLKQSLQEAFSGPVLTGGRAMMETGDASEAERSASTPPLPSLDACAGARAAHERRGEERHRSGRGRPRRRSRASRRSSAGSTSSSRRPAWPRRSRRPSSRRGLKVRLMTDKLLFDSGSAVIKPAASTRLRDRRDHRGRGRAPRGGRGSHRRSPDHDFAVPVQLAAVRRTRRGGRPAPRAPRRRAATARRSVGTRRSTRSRRTPRRSGGPETAGSRSS